MTLNILILFTTTFFFISGIYKLYMIKTLRKLYLSQYEYTSFLEYGISEAGFKPFIRLKWLHLGKIVETKFYYKFVSKFYLFQVVLTILTYIGLLVVNYFDKAGYMNINL